MTTILAHYKGLGLDERSFHDVFRQTPRQLHRLGTPLEHVLNANTNRPVRVEVTDWKDPDLNKYYIQIKAARWNPEITDLLRETAKAYYHNPTNHNFTVHLSAVIDHSNEWTRKATHCFIGRDGNLTTRLDDNALLDVLNKTEDYVLIHADITDMD
ncbi:MAG: hypothetical protein HDQ88_08810 [Clostridia bacterium]|nr:hypothetical protein [Clostridia bacterium]